MELSYIHDCPSCGAPVEVAEADRVVECQYCDGRNYMVGGGPLRFVLPDMIPSEIDEDQILHIPYLRFKGHIYSCIGGSLQHKIVDTTQLGIGGNSIPASLGLRPQAMQIRLLAADNRGRFSPLTEKVRDIFSKAARLTTAFSESSDTIYHRSFIGETISYIYLPTYIRDSTLIDGVLNRPIGTGVPKQSLMQKSVICKKEWLPRFIATICPHCAALMTGNRDSLVMECGNCQSLWLEQKGGFSKIAHSFVSPGEGDNFLPFWKISTNIKGLQLKSFADFLRLTNHPVVIREEHEKMHHNFWLPAFKIRPKYFLQAAKNLTVTQNTIPDEKIEFQGGLYPATLPLQEAVQAIKAVLTEAAVNKKLFIPSLPRVKVGVDRAELVYLPFHALGHDLIQDHTSVTLSKRTLYFGRTM